MTTIVRLCTAGAADLPLARAIADALPRYGRRGAIRVVTEGDPAAADWFLLLASPDSAHDPAVADALETRLGAVGVERLQVVVTGGTWLWDPDAGGLTAASTAAPPALRRAFPAEPRHLVYEPGPSGASRRNALFREQMAELAAPLIGTTKDALVGEDVQRQRRTRFLTRAGALALVLLLVAAGAGGLLAARGTQAADRARHVAEAERDAADSRRLAALSQQVAGRDGALARVLAVEAWRIAETAQAEAALELAAQTSGDWEVTTVSDEVTRLLGHAPHPLDVVLSGAHVATVDAASTVRIWPLGESAAPLEISDVPGVTGLAWSHDGTVLAAASGEVHLFDAAGTHQGGVQPQGSAQLVGPWGDGGFATAGSSVTLLGAGGVVVERTVQELGIVGRPSLVQGSADGQTVLVGTDLGEVVLLDDDLEPLAQWTLTVVIDQFGERDSARALAWDGDDRVILPPDNDGVLGPIMGMDGAPDARDGAIAGVYDAHTGDALDALALDGSIPLPATSGAFLPDGSAIGLTPGGLEAPPALGATAGAPDLSGVPLPADAALMRVSPDGAWLAVSGSAAEVHLVPIGDATAGPETAGPADGSSTAGGIDRMERACAAAGRNLTAEEWTVHLPDRDYRPTCEGLG